LHFRLTVGGCGERYVGTVKVLSVFALVSLVFTLALVIVANTEQCEADNNEDKDNYSTCDKTTSNIISVLQTNNGLFRVAAKAGLFIYFYFILL